MRHILAKKFVKSTYSHGFSSGFNSTSLVLLLKEVIKTKENVLFSGASITLSRIQAEQDMKDAYMSERAIQTKLVMK